jgi:hypothetical protein
LTGKNDFQNDSSSVKSPQNQPMDVDELDNEDGVLNLSIEDHPYIVPVGLDSLFTVGMYVNSSRVLNNSMGC